MIRPAESPAPSAKRARPSMKEFTPTELLELRTGGWSGAGPFRLDEGLPLDELGGAVFLRRVRIFLRLVAERGRVPATAGGRLDPHFVAGLMRPLEWSPETLADAVDRSRLVDGRAWLDERDIFPLWILRVVLERAQLLERAGPSFRLTPLGGELAAPAAAGRLFARLFRTALRDVDLRLLDDRAPAPAPIEHRVRALRRIGGTAWTWAAEGELASHLVEVRKPDGPLSVADWREAVLRTRDELIEPLLGFGLLRRRALRAPAGGRPLLQFRKTPLFDRLLRFHFEDEIEEAEPESAHVLPLERREREHLFRRVSADRDLARRVRLPPLDRGWARVSLTGSQLRTLLGAAFDAGEPLPPELGSAIGRMLCLARGLPLDDPELPPELRGEGPPELVPAGITVELSDRERARLRHQPELLEELHPRLSADLMSEAGGVVPLRFGEAILLRDLLDDAALSGETPDIVAHDCLAMLRRLEGELERQWAMPGRGAWFLRPLRVSPTQRIPVALRRSEARLLEELEDLPREIAERLEPGENGTGWLIALTLAEVERLADEFLVRLDEDRVARLEARLDLVLRCFEDGLDHPGAG